jgi:hypothetical protein
MREHPHFFPVLRGPKRRLAPHPAATVSSQTGGAMRPPPSTLGDLNTLLRRLA